MRDRRSGLGCMGDIRLVSHGQELLCLFMLCFLKYFLWSVVALQHCVSFGCTARSIRHTHIRLSDFLPLRRPLELPVLSSLSSLVSYFMYSVSGVYVSVLISQFSHFPFPPGHAYICSLRLCFCFAIKIVYTIFLDSMHMR